jgi:hypothetical protein
VGNFPQAFSHVSLINSAFRLSGADPLAPLSESARTLDDRTITAPAVQRLRRIGRNSGRRWPGLR